MTEMPRREVEDAMLQMGIAMRTLIQAFAPDANHCEISVIDGNIYVDACHYDSALQERVETFIDAALYPDGTVRHGKEFTFPEKDGAA